MDAAVGGDSFIFIYFHHHVRPLRKMNRPGFSRAWEKRRLRPARRRRRVTLGATARAMGCGASTSKHGAASVLTVQYQDSPASPRVDAKTMRRIRRRSCAVHKLSVSPVAKSQRTVTRFVPTTRDEEDGDGDEA